jgi:sporulation protein YlmC with PRC-barrel domain
MAKPTAWLAGLLVTSAVALSSQAQTQTQTIDLANWDPSELKNGWLATQMTDTPVYGRNGEDIGEVSNVIVGRDDKVESIIVEAGGFLDIGDTHFSVPWDQVELTPGEEGVVVPVNEDNVEDFSLFGDDEVEEGPRSWRITELVGDAVRLEGGTGYGIVYDVVFDQDGTLKSVLVNPDIGYGVGGYYAYPWYGYDYGYEPGDPYYDMPYDRDEIGGVESFDIGTLDAGLI